MIQSRVTLLVRSALVTQGNFSKDVVVIVVVIVEVTMIVEDKKKVMDVLIFINMGKNDIVQRTIENCMVYPHNMHMQLYATIDPVA